ncbi:phosphatidylserine decarboxylase [Flavobacteriaceae bacterium 3-367]|uniref:phosphatidylserine decarboxylase n=1 Tax=Eudoraea algarum TaxID=3417568 RepID=UPI00327EA753
METSTLESYYSDPHFTVFKVPQWRANLYQFLSVSVWGKLPSHIQKKVSAAYASTYDKPYSKWIIKPYIKINYQDKNYLEKFKPPKGKKSFDSFQDFFIREFRTPPKNESPYVWPCEGLLCDEGKVGDIDRVKVKCDERNITTIFGVAADTIPDNYSFTNVFLHNKNYHRIHSPIEGTISRIQHVPGDLVVLRPWIYKQNPSLPAFRNERYNIDITDADGRVWYMSIVGGPAVGTIELSEHIALGNKVGKLQEVALFYLGSTCCMAAPLDPKFHSKNTFVEVGASY